MSTFEWIGRMIVKYNLTVEAPSQNPMFQYPEHKKWWVHREDELRNESDEVVDTEVKTGKNLDLVAAINELVSKEARYVDPT